MGSIFVKIEHDVLDFLKGAGKAAETVVVSDGQAAVAAAKQTELGQLAVSLVQVFKNHAMSGTQKLAAVVGALIPAAESLIASGGVKGIVGEVSNFARELAQSTFNDLETAEAKVVGSAIAPNAAPPSPGAA